MGDPGKTMVYSTVNLGLMHKFTWQCSNCDRGSAIKMRCGTHWNIPLGCDLAESIYFIHSPCGPSHVLLPRVAAWLPSTSCVFLPTWKQTHISLTHTGKSTDRRTDRQTANVPNAPPISAPLVGMLTFTMPQSDPLGLERKKASFQWIGLPPLSNVYYTTDSD